ncbi:MAG: YbhB/YbcL family Raf kinase inhibitor-like protein [Burkholderiales bacterium]|nr:YbhB/YbcL family Raf kinase inhibitor-like protein [Burkholderiales bacterium]
MSLTLTSVVFTHHGEMQQRYTCDGDDISPPLAWSGIQAGANSLALIVYDPDAPDPAHPQRIWVHWVLYNLPPNSTGLSEQISPQALPMDTLHGVNDWGRTGYGGPCPPIGRHRYFFALYALDTMLPDLGKPSRLQLMQAMQGHILAQTELVGTYQRGER